MTRSPIDSLPPAAASDEPLYRQIYDRFRGAIAQGMLKPGDRIPSARALAKDLGVARGTIEMAYSLLHAEGYVQPRGRAGTVVTPGLQAHTVTKPAPAPVKPDPDTWRHPPSVLPFQMGLPALDAFPRKIWARLGARHLRATQAADLSYPPADGLPALRTAIAAHLQVARGIHCTPSQVFITSGYRESLNLVIQALLQPGQQVWVEDPGYPPTRELLTHAGLELAPIEVDAEGIMVARGIEQAPQALSLIHI